MQGQHHTNGLGDSDSVFTSARAGIGIIHLTASHRQICCKMVCKSRKAAMSSQ
jgi:hypothetical protein